MAARGSSASEIYEKSDCLHYRVNKNGAGNNDYYAVIVKCPACGRKFRSMCGEGRTTHIGSHSPEDFGLSPLLD